MKTLQRNRHHSAVRAKFDRKSGLVRLNVPLSVKADAIDLTARTFEGLAATWDEDLGQDVIEKGAFKKSISNWKSSQDALPLLNSHDHYDIFAALGQAVQMKETPEGLWTKWEVLPGDDGDKVLQRLRPSPTTGRAIIGKMSIGFTPLQYSYEQPPGTESFFDRIRHIQEADLKEVSLVLFPMNPNASIDASTVKMWLKMAHDADPTKLDSLTRLELRRLNSKIGLLLKKQQPADDEQEAEEDDEQDTPSTRTTSRTRVTPTDDSDDATDDSEDDDGDLSADEGDEEGITDDEPDETDDTDTDDASDDPVDDTTEESESTAEGSAAPTGTKGKKKTEKKKVEEPDEPAPYVFGEALQQRLASVTLKHKTSALKTRQ